MEQKTRNVEIFTAVINGDTHISVAVKYQITPARVAQIFDACRRKIKQQLKHQDNPRGDYGLIKDCFTVWTCRANKEFFLRNTDLINQTNWSQKAMDHSEVLEKLDAVYRETNNAQRRHGRRNAEIFIALLNGETPDIVGARHGVTRSRIHVLFTDHQQLITFMLKKNGNPDYKEVAWLKTIEECRARKDIFLKHLDFLVHRYKPAGVTKKQCRNEVDAVSPHARPVRLPKAPVPEETKQNGVNDPMAMFCR